MGQQEVGQNCDWISRKCVRSVMFQQEFVQEWAWVSSNRGTSVRGSAGIGSGVRMCHDEVW